MTHLACSPGYMGWTYLGKNPGSSAVVLAETKARDRIPSCAVSRGFDDKEVSRVVPAYSLNLLIASDDLNCTSPVKTFWASQAVMSCPCLKYTQALCS